MPFVSKAQRRKFYAMAAAGEMPQATVDRWEKETKGRLPERVKRKPKMKKHATVFELLAKMAGVSVPSIKPPAAPGEGPPPIQAPKPAPMSPTKMPVLDGGAPRRQAPGAQQPIMRPKGVIATGATKTAQGNTEVQELTGRDYTQSLAGQRNALFGHGAGVHGVNEGGRFAGKMGVGKGVSIEKKADLDIGKVIRVSAGTGVGGSLGALTGLLAGGENRRIEGVGRGAIAGGAAGALLETSLADRLFDALKKNVSRKAHSNIEAATALGLPIVAATLAARAGREKTAAGDRYGGADSEGKMKDNQDEDVESGQYMFGAGTGAAKGKKMTTVKKETEKKDVEFRPFAKLAGREKGTWNASAPKVTGGMFFKAASEEKVALDMEDVKGIGAKAGEGAAAAGAKIKDMLSSAKPQLENVLHAANESVRTGTEYLKNNPNAALAATVGAGGLGLLGAGKALGGVGRLVRGKPKAAPGLLKRLALAVVSKGRAR